MPTILLGVRREPAKLLHVGEVFRFRRFQVSVDNWDNYPAFLKRGTYVRRRIARRTLTIAEIEALPPQHEARRVPNLVVQRGEYAVLDMPPLSRVANRADVVFHGAEPDVIELQSRNLGVMGPMIREQIYEDYLDEKIGRISGPIGEKKGRQ